MLLLIASAGCGTFGAKVSGPDGTSGWWLGLGHPYEGVPVDVGTLHCVWDQSHSEPIVLRLLVSIGLIIDMPLSLVADTLFLPIDLFVEPKRTRVDPGVCNSPLLSR